MHDTPDRHLFRTADRAYFLGLHPPFPPAGIARPAVRGHARVGPGAGGTGHRVGRDLHLSLRNPPRVLLNLTAPPRWWRGMCACARIYTIWISR